MWPKGRIGLPGDALAPVVMWFRRDLRLGDNRALQRAVALADGDAVHAFFGFSAPLMAKGSPKRISYMVQALISLDRSLGNSLNFSYGDPAEDVARFAGSVGATTVVATRDFSSLGCERDRRAGALLASQGIDFQLGDSPYLVAPGKIARETGQWYRVFTPYYNGVLSHGFQAPLGVPLLALAPRRLMDAKAQRALDVPPQFDLGAFPASEEAALRRLGEFLDHGAASYKLDRNDPFLDGTSRLSPAIRFGVIHPRQIAQAAIGVPGGEEVLRQVIWRDFFAQVGYSSPLSTWDNFDRRYDLMAWDDPSVAAVAQRLQAWKSGTTGYPIVDAGMRQLVQTGWMHNRVRMIAASFLIKDLHVDWKIGARFYLEHLIDGDIASNNLSWQWVAGSGTDSAPYFRVFNPVLQSKKFDPSGRYIAKYLPELSKLPARFIHEPWAARAHGLLGAGGYPEPIVTHEIERAEALRRYAQMIQASAPAEL